MNGRERRIVQNIAIRIRTTDHRVSVILIMLLIPSFLTKDVWKWTSMGAPTKVMVSSLVVPHRQSFRHPVRIFHNHHHQTTKTILLSNFRHVVQQRFVNTSVKAPQTILYEQQRSLDTDDGQIGTQVNKQQQTEYVDSTKSNWNSIDNIIPNDNDTIFALSSGGSNSGQATAVAVIRITGPYSKLVLEHMLLHHHVDNENSSKIKSTKRFSVPKARYAAVRTLYNWVSYDVLDQAIVIYFPGPNSFTGEDIVELHCHGSKAVVQAVLSCLQQPLSTKEGSTHNCRLAEPGEFAQRAWGNGKLDLLQIEALADLLAADTNQQLQQAIQQLDGSLSRLYTSWRSTLIEALSHAEAVIDFGDDESLLDDEEEDDLYDNDGDITIDTKQQNQQRSVWGSVIDKIQLLQQQMEYHLRDARRGELVRDGISIAIIGPPNAGKSSLFNVLAQRDAAIVSSTAGTTRDVIEITMNLGGYKCTIQDTAGVRDATTDQIEIEGMKRAIQAASVADIVIAIVDTTNSNEGYDVVTKVVTEITNQNSHDNHDDNTDEVLDSTTTPSLSSTSITALPKNMMLIRNKADLDVSTNGIESSHQTSTDDDISGTIQSLKYDHTISCITQNGIDTFLDDLTNRVAARVGITTNNNNDDDEETTSRIPEEIAYITRARHRYHIQNAVQALQRFQLVSSNGLITADLAAEELRLASSELGRVTGAIDVEDILDKLFSDFCIGK